LTRNLFAKAIVVGCLLIASTCTIVAQRKRGIRAVDFRHFTYYPVTQTNFANDGREQKGKGFILRRGRDAGGHELKSVKYFDFAGDGNEGALVTISTSGGGGSMEDLYLEDYFVFAYSNGRAMQVFAKSRFAPDGIRVEGHDLVLTAPFWGPEGRRCCPVANETSKYRWNGTGFEQVSRDLRAIQ
jgi:hypothetical protein